MSHFDFPRIHFDGVAVVDPGTGNNNYFFPLVIFDPDQTRALLPPRIVLLPETLENNAVKNALLPLDSFIRYPESGAPFLELSPVNTPERFKRWATTPLGQFAEDQPFHILYTLLKAHKTGAPLAGVCPGFWNYYGTMTFDFEAVRVSSVVLGPEAEHHFELGDSNCPPFIHQLLGASVRLKDSRSRNGAVMIDPSPTLSIYSQVFSDLFLLEQGGEALLRGVPLKASMRGMNINRVMNQAGILGASGAFCCAIPLDALDDGNSAPVVSFFSAHVKEDASLKGVFLRYVLAEVFEDQNPDYEALGANSNPSRMSVFGTLAPWYEGDFKSVAPGRLLQAVHPFAVRKFLPSVVCVHNDREGLLFFDFLNALPLENLSLKGASGTVPPYPHAYETADIGELLFEIREQDGLVHRIGSLKTGPDHLSRSQLLRGGGLVDFDVSNLNVDWNSVEVVVRKSSPGKRNDPMLLREAPYMIFSDEAGLYIDQDDHPEDGYLSYRGQKEPCLLRVFRRGKPVEEAVRMTVVEISMVHYGAMAESRIFQEGLVFRDGSLLDFPAEIPGNRVYGFFPETGDALPQDLLRSLLQSGAFVNLRVLPVEDFSKWLDPSHPDYVFPIPFSVIEEALLSYFDLIYPVSAIITPFTEDHFRKIRKFLRLLVSSSYWQQALYMPSSRDMPAVKRQLLLAWLDQQDQPQDGSRFNISN